MRLAGLALALLLALPARVRSEEPPTNLDLVVAAVERAADDALAKAPELAPRSAGAVVVAPQAPHAANWVLDHVLSERLLARGFAVTLDSTSTTRGSARLAYRILDLGVSGRSGLGGSTVERRARASLAFSLSRGDSLQWQQESGAVLRDRVPRNRLELLGNAAYPFTKAELEERSFGRFVEPFIVSTVLGGLIYLFFANR
ncbi:MAG: hypothetical protein WDA75_06130 [Candidatus Latescibacterota bacterium]|jgi:hypothetical protein